MNAIALTDHGSMFGALEFAEYAIKNGLLPIIGCEVYVAKGSIYSKESRARPENDTKRQYHHLVLLVQNESGYKNLSKLSSIGYLDGFYYKPRIDKELLAEHSEGLIALSACIRGEVPSLLLAGKDEEAESVALFYKEIFNGKFFLELQDHGLEEQQIANKKLIALAKRCDLKVVATNDAHYLNQEDSEAHDALLCIGAGKLLTDVNRIRYHGDQFYLKSTEEMLALFKDVPDAITNTQLITEMIGFSFETNKNHLPNFPIPDDTTIESYLESRALHGLEGRFREPGQAALQNDLDRQAKYKRRLQMELKVINNMGFPGYFLISADFVEYAKANNIAVGPGRGSAAGSMVAFALGITGVDPIKHGLVFERFLNPERISMPDIDIDFCMEGRQKVINYVRAKYEKVDGPKMVSQIITFGALKAKAVLRDVARVMNIPYKEADRIAKLVPDKLNITIDRALETEPKLAADYKNSPEITKLIDVAKVLEGVTRHTSTHAAGVVISPSALTDFLPLYKASGSPDITTQFQMNDVERLGLLKMDFLGLKTLTVIQKTIDKIKINSNIEIDINNIDITDQKTFKLLQDIRTFGVFQLESSGMRDLIRKMQPKKFEDIVALVALFRPGPINSGMTDTYIKNKNNQKKIRYDFPILEKELGETYGVIVYQEQVMRIANILAGFSFATADILRKAIGKKKQDLMSNLQEQFVEGALKNGHNRTKIERLWKQIEKFGEYGFNKSHSVCYAIIAYQTAYLKSHYPAEYFAALMSAEIDNADKIYQAIKELQSLNIAILPPDINESIGQFKAEENSIRFGLNALKGVGISSAEAIIAARNNSKTKFSSIADCIAKVNSIADLLNGNGKTIDNSESHLHHADEQARLTANSNGGSTRSTPINKRVLEALVCSGTFDQFNDNRKELFDDIESILKRAQKKKNDLAIGQEALFSSPDPVGKLANKESSSYWSESEKLAHEKDSLGFYLSSHPLSQYEQELKLICDCDTSQVATQKDRSKVRIGGIIGSIKELRTKKGELMARVILEDMNGHINTILFPATYNKNRDLLESNIPLVIVGELDINSAQDATLVAEEIIQIEDAIDQFSSKLTINIVTTGLDISVLKSLEQLLRSSKGRSEVTLKLHDPLGIVTLLGCKPKARISSGLIKKIEEIVGEDRVTLS